MPRSIAEIKKVKTGFRVRYFANNGEMLATSEVLTSAAKGKKNIKAMVKLLTSDFDVIEQQFFGSEFS